MQTKSDGGVVRREIGVMRESAAETLKTVAGAIALSTTYAHRHEGIPLEASSLRLHHPRIVNLKEAPLPSPAGLCREAFWEGDLCFIVMDLARGVVPGAFLK